MADQPKTLSDVKALLEEAVQVVNNLEANATEAPAQELSNDAPVPPTNEDTSEAAGTDNPTPPTA